MQPADIAPKDRLIVPLDLPGVAEAEAMIARLGDSVSFYKIGYQLAYAGGLPLAQQLAKSGVPKHAVNLKRMMAAHHGVLIVTPEYNSSVPALVKNTIDWVSRVQDAHETRGQVFRERVFAIASASGGRLGGARALAALRLILSACQAQVIPNQLALPFAEQAYDEMERLKNSADAEALKALVRQLIDHSQRLM